MGDPIGIHNMDLDIQSFIKKRMDDDESIVYVRLKDVDEENCDVIWAINGNLVSIIEAFADTPELREVCNLVTAALVHNNDMKHWAVVLFMQG